jgi:pimeloyl-ACP methyl ester carboxylesterase
MLHGWNRSLESLEGLAKLIKSPISPHLIDLPGFGQSPPPPVPWSSVDYALSLKEHLDRLKQPQVDLFGHSFGGKVALSFASRFPERVRRLILVSASGLKRKHSFKRRAQRKMLSSLRAALKIVDQTFHTHLFANYFVPRFASKDYLEANEMRGTFLKTIHEDLQPILPSIQAPTLLLWGERDQETPYEMAERMHRLLPHSQLIRLPRQGHDPFGNLSTHLLAYHIRQFLNA